jgi:hypothetical protein
MEKGSSLWAFALCRLVQESTELQRVASCLVDVFKARGSELDAAKVSRDDDKDIVDVLFVVL